MVDQIEFAIAFFPDIKLGDHKNRHQKWVDDLELAFTNSKDINLGDLKADTRQVVDQIEFACPIPSATSDGYRPGRPQNKWRIRLSL